MSKESNKKAVQRRVEAAASAGVQVQVSDIVGSTQLYLDSLHQGGFSGMASVDLHLNFKKGVVSGYSMETKALVQG